jgi:predicted lipid-binding transport protein (Tim44 family)
MGRGTRVTLLVALVALVAPAVGGVVVANPTTAGVDATETTAATAPNATVSVERVDTNEIRVNVTFVNETRNESAFTVKVTDTGVSKNVTFRSKRNGSSHVQTLAVTELTDPNTTTDLSSATVAVEENGSVLDDSPVNLQYADLSEVSQAFDDDVVRISNVSLRGFQPESSVGLAVGNESVRATYEGGETEALVLDEATLSNLSRDVLFGDALVAVEVKDGPGNVTTTATSVNVQRAAVDATRLVLRDDSLSVENPLVGVLDANRYALDLTTTDPAGRYVDVVAASGTTVPLPDDAIGATLNVTLDVDDSTQQRVLDDWSGDYADRSVNVTVDGSYVRVPSGFEADAILYEGADGLERVALNALAEGNQRYDLADNATVPVGATVVLTAGGDVYTGTTGESDGGSTENDSEATTDGESSGDTGESSGFLPYSLGSTAIIVVVALLVGALYAVGLAALRSFLDSSVEGARPTDVAGAVFVLGVGFLLSAVVGVIIIVFLTNKNMLPAAVIGGVFGMIGSWPTAQALTTAGFWGKTTQRRRSAGRNDSPVPVTVQVVTEDNRRVNEPVELTARSTARTDDVSESTSTGRAKLQLKPGTWTITAALPNQEFETTLEIESGHARSEQARIVCERPKIAVKLSDGTDGNPLSEATVRVEPDAGERTEKRTDERGKAGIVLPFAAAEVTVTVSHPKYVSVTRDVSLDDHERAFDVNLERKVGSLSVTAEVDGVATGGLPVGVEPAADDDFRARERAGTLQTDRDGTATTELLVGDYVVDLDLPPSQTSQFRTNTSSVTIKPGARARVSVGATFEYTLPSATRNRLSDVRADVDALSDRSGRDVAFPQYYGSVVQSLLDVVETLPEQGHRFVNLDASPDAVADAIIGVAAGVVPRVNTAMTTKRNVDVFAACADMPDVNVQWRGESASFDAFVDRVDDPGDAEMTRRIEETKERIDRERGQLTEVEPATEVWELSRDLFQEARREEDDVQRAAKTMLVTALLDAVEGTFEHDRLRERMKQTVF